MISSLPPLVAARAGNSAFSGLFLPLAILAALVIVGTVVLLLLRRSITGQGRGDASGFTLHDLRTMRDDGRITEDEFQKARASIIERVQARSDDLGEDEDAPPADEQSE